MALAGYGSQVRPVNHVTRTAAVRNAGYAYWADDEQNVVGITASKLHAMREAHVSALRIEKLEGRDVREYGWYLVRRENHGAPWIVVNS